jgi:hypothetical protein
MGTASLAAASPLARTADGLNSGRLCHFPRDFKAGGALSPKVVLAPESPPPAV